MNLVEQFGAGLTGLEQLKAMLAVGGRAPIGETLGFTFVDVGDGWAAFEGVPGFHVYNPIGSVHGGYIAALLDSACGCAGHSKLSATQAYTTLELKIAYHKAVTDKTGLVRAEGRVVTFGRRVAYTEATLKDKDGKLYASATSTLLVFER